MDERGYQVVTGAATAEAIAAYARERAEAWEALLVREGGTGFVELASRAQGQAGAVDPYAVLPAARAILLAEPITTALTERFAGEAPLLFDAAETAAAAPEDGPYRDATYTALASAPETLVTLVVALGEAGVIVHPGSQAIATTPFSGRYPHFNPERDGEDAIARHRGELTAALGDGERATLSPGDALILAAGTVHRAPEGATLTAHVCPKHVDPGWFAYRPERARYAKLDDGRACIASQHYDLVDAIEPERDPDPDAIEQVEEALREHDRELATDPPPGDGAGGGGPRRGGGLVDSVRGILGRRGRGGGGGR
jgi:hypothetical protein